MANNFQRGDLIPTAFQVFGTSNLFNMEVRKHAHDEEVLTFDVTSTKHGGITARIAGKFDAKGTVEAFVDIDEAPWKATPFIRPGVAGLFARYASPTLFWQIPALIQHVHYQQAIDNAFEYSFDWQLSSIFGVFVYPSF